MKLKEYGKSLGFNKEEDYLMLASIYQEYQTNKKNAQTNKDTTQLQQIQFDPSNTTSNIGAHRFAIFPNEFELISDKLDSKKESLEKQAQVIEQKIKSNITEMNKLSKENAALLALQTKLQTLIDTMETVDGQAKASSDSSSSKTLGQQLLEVWRQTKEKEKMKTKLDQQRISMKKKMQEQMISRNNMRAQLINHQKSQQSVMKSFWGYIQQHITDLWLKYSWMPIQCRNVWCTVAKKTKKGSRIDSIMDSITDSVQTAFLMQYEFIKNVTVAFVDSLKQFGSLTTVIECVAQTKRKVLVDNILSKTLQ